MIEIGNERTFESGTRRIASAFDAMGGLLVIAWLLRGILQIAPYSETMLLVAFSFGLMGRVFRTRTNTGVARAVSSFLGNIAFWCIFTILMVWILGWIAGIQNPQNVPDLQFPVVIGQQVPNLAIAAIATAILSLGTREMSPTQRGPLVQGPAIVVRPSSVLALGKVKLVAKKDSIALPIRRFRRTLGALLVGDVTASFDTPMGTVTANIPGPVTTVGVPLRGEKTDKDGVTKLTGKPLEQLVEESQVDASIPREDGVSGDSYSPFWEGGVDMPFVHVSRGVDGESVEVGPVTVRRNRGGSEEVKVGPFSISSDDWDGTSWAKASGFGAGKHGGSRWRRGGFNSWWLLKGNRGMSYIMTASFDGVDARWNGSSLKLRGDWMKMSVGSDGFTYSPTQLETYSPLHSLQITQSKATLNTRKFTLNVSEDKVLLRSEEGTKRTDSNDLARDLRDLLAETAKKQVKNVIAGQPIELDEMLARTEEVLKKYE